MDGALDERMFSAETVLQIQARERRKIGQLLHDGPCQDLIGAAFALKAVAGRAGASAVAAELNEAIRLLNVAVTRTRALSTGLNPLALHGSRLGVALLELCKILPEGITPTVEVNEEGSWDDVVSAELFRIAEEAVNNTGRHSKATQLTIRIVETHEALELSIADNGCGFTFTPHMPRALGLEMMHLCAQGLQGCLQIETAVNAGTKIRCVLPKKHDQPASF